MFDAKRACLRSILNKLESLNTSVIFSIGNTSLSVNLRWALDLPHPCNSNECIYLSASKL
jgi:hypothetical protein